MSAPAKSRAVTLLDVATRAGVDRSVVSRVLSDDPRLNIREETRARVLAAVRELDYRPNAVARSLRTRRSDTYGLLIPDFGNPVYASIIQGAQSGALARDCVLLTGSVGAVNDQAQHLDVIGRGRVDGLLLAGDNTDRAQLDELDRLSIPWLLVNRRIPRARRWVVLDDEQAAGLAVRHLIELGHERIAHIAGPRSADTARRRLSGWRRAMREAGLTTPASALVVSDYTPEGGAQALRELLGRGGERPTAVLVANVAAAIGTLAAAAQAGVRIPDELSVVAVHDLPLAAYLRPALTTVRTPLERLGAQAIELLATSEPDEPIEQVVSGELELVERASTAPPPDRTT